MILCRLANRTDSKKIILMIRQDIAGFLRRRLLHIPARQLCHDIVHAPALYAADMRMMTGIGIIAECFFAHIQLLRQSHLT